MAEAEAYVPPENKGKGWCFRGAKCKHRNCKFSHPPPASKVTADDTTAHDPPVPSKEATNAIQEDMSRHKYAFETTTSKKKTPKHCKFGNHCTRKNCQYFHPAKQETSMTSFPSESTTTDGAISKEKSNRDSDGLEGARPSEMAPPGRYDARNDAPALQDTVSQQTSKHESVERKQKPAKKKHCFRGSKCSRPNCPYWHPQDTISLMKHDGQPDDTVAIMDVATLEGATETKATKIPLAADLEASLVAEAQQKQQHSLTRTEPQQPVMPQSHRRKKRGKEIDMRRRRQEQEDRLIQDEEELLRLKQQEEELDRMLQDQERQRQAEAEAALVTEQARIEINRIRRDLAAEKEEAKRFAQDLQNPEHVRAEREALERFKRAHEEEKKSEEAARRLQEEERRLLNQQDELIRRERENEVEFRRLAQEKETDCRSHQEEAKKGACRLEKAVETQEAVLPDETDEERERYKAERRAAKKERRRLEREAKEKQDVTPTKETSMQSLEPKQEQSVSFAGSPTGSNQENANDANTPDTIEDEEDKKRRWQEELRRQKERVAEKKAEKQKLRRERMLEDFERQTQERSQFWQTEIADEKKTVDLLVQLCVAEFCRKNPDVDRQTLLADAGVKEKLEEAARETFRAVCKAEIHSRVVVKGMKQQDLNDRTGTIQSWDESKKKFYVGLDTKKGKNTQYMYLLPGNLEALPLPSPRMGKKRSDPVHMVFISSFFADTELMVDVYKTEVDQMKKAASVDDFVEQLMLDRDREEREAKEQEEEDRRREEEACKRRAEQRHRENEEWERRQREYAEQKAEYREWRRQQRKEKRANAEARRGGRDYFEQDEHARYCHCSRCEFENSFYGSGMGGRGDRGPGFFFSFGPGGPGIFFSFGDDDYDDDYEDQWDRQWEQMHEEELAEKNAEAAEILGVEIEADEAEIKRVFRKKARKYHPDSYRAENHEGGMTKEEAEEHFKELSSAYDHLMSNFDDDSE